MKYPKLWNGPSPVGESLVRALQQTGEPFLRASTADGVSAGVSGGFQEVTHGGAVQFSSSGRIRRGGKVEDITVTSEWYSKPFLARGTAQTKDTNRRKTVSYSIKTEEYRQDFVYPHYGSGLVLTFNGFRFESNIYETRLLRKKPYRQIGSIDQLVIRPAIFFITNFFRVGPRAVVINVEDKVPTEFMYWFADLGDTDLGGAPCPQPVYARLTWGIDDEGYIFTYPNSLLPNSLARRYEPEIMAVVGPNTFYVILISHWMYTTNHTDDVSARVRLLYTTTGGASWSVRDITSLLLDPQTHFDHREPEMTYAVMSEPPSPPPGGSWLVEPQPDYWNTDTSRRNRGAGLPEGVDASTTQRMMFNVQETFKGSNIYTYSTSARYVFPHTPDQQNDIIRNRLYITASFIGVDNGEALLSVLHDNGVSAFNVGALYRFTPSAAIKISESSSENVFSYIQTMIYLGSRAVLAKRTYGFAGTNFDVKFELSLDNGATFVEVPATGLPGLRKNRFFGRFTRVKPYISQQDQGIVLISAFDESKMSYFAYASRDAGRTWKECARLAKTEQFYRVDTMLNGDGGGNFMNVAYFGTNTRPSQWNSAIESMNVTY